MFQLKNACVNKEKYRTARFSELSVSRLYRFALKFKLYWFIFRVTRLGDLSPFRRLFKAHGDNYFDPNFWRLFGRFLKDGSNLNFLCYKENLNLKFWRNCHFGQLLHQKEYQKYVFLAIKEVRTDTKYHFGQLLLQKEDPKYAILTTKTSQNWLGDFGRLFSWHWATFYQNHLVTSFIPIVE